MDYEMNRFTSGRVKLAVTTALALVMAGGVTDRMGLTNPARQKRRTIDR